MGIRFHRKKKEKIKGAGDVFYLEDYEIYDDFNVDIRESVIHYAPNLLVSEVKKDPYIDYKVIKNIGEGTFGKVDLVEHKISGMVRAMKIIKKANVINPQINNEDSVLNELNILKRIDHQNVVKIYEFYSDDTNYYLITEYCAGGDLYDATIKERLSEVQVACIIYQVLLALNYIHKMKIMHRDLKPENILVTKKEKNGLYRIKLCDFGTSHLFKDGEKEKDIIGSSYYIAPEVLKQKYDFKCDLWSCGVIMYVLLTKKIPFLGEDDKEIRKSIKKRKYNPGPIQGYSKYIQNLIEDLLVKNDKRINAEKALSYDLFTVYKCKDIINKMDVKEIKPFLDNMKKYKKHSIFKETAISYLIHNSDLDEISEALKLFNKLDKNENGKITFMELYDGIYELTGEKLNKEEFREIYYNIDSNKNNYIEPEEFVKASIDKKLFLSEEMIKFAFNFFDIDNSGLITLGDIVELFKSNINSDKEAMNEFNKIIGSIDTDENGKIDYEEFKKFMKTLLEEE